MSYVTALPELRSLTGLCCRYTNGVGEGEKDRGVSRPITCGLTITTIGTSVTGASSPVGQCLGLASDCPPTEQHSALHNVYTQPSTQEWGPAPLLQSPCPFRPCSRVPATRVMPAGMRNARRSSNRFVSIDAQDSEILYDSTWKDSKISTEPVKSTLSPHGNSTATYTFHGMLPVSLLPRHSS